MEAKIEVGISNVATFLLEIHDVPSLPVKGLAYFAKLFSKGLEFAF